MRPISSQAGPLSRKRKQIMIKRFSRIIAVLLFTACAAAAQDAKVVLESASRAMGATNLKTVEYSGTGSDSALGIGQNYRPEDPWPSFNAKSYVYAANYATPAAREEIVSTQANPVRGGGFQPIVGERRQVQFVNGLFAWDLNVAAFQKQS